MELGRYAGQYKTFGSVIAFFALISSRCIIAGRRFCFILLGILLLFVERYSNYCREKLVRKYNVVTLPEMDMM